MLRTLLIWGLLAGLIAGVAAFGTAYTIGEPALGDAIAYEEANAEPEPAVAADGHAHSHGEGTEVSRDTQSTIGLLTGTSIYGLAFGGLFGLFFAYAYGRLFQASPRVTATWLGFFGFLTVFLVPFLKYPATPPAIGDPETIGDRTLLYFGMIVISLLSAFIAYRARKALLETRPDVASLVGVVTFLVIVVVAGVALPGVSEIPADFPAVSLWEFRIGTIGTQATLWAVLTVVFSYAAQRAMTRDQPAVAPAPSASAPVSG